MFMVYDIDRFFELHRDWIETFFKEGEPLVLLDTDFRKYDLSDKILEGVYMIDSQFDDKDLNCLNFFRARLCFSTCTNAVVTRCEFVDADLEEVNFSGAVFERVNFTDSDCRSTDFSDANISRCEFIDTHLNLTNFTNARICDTEISGSIFDGTILNGAVMKNVRGINEAIFKSINIGTKKEPVILEYEDAERWMEMNNVI